MPRQFQGEIKLDVRQSTADWPAFLANRAPEGAPNVLVVLYDDTGCAAWSTYGGRINMPTMDRLAANGLTYSQWHTTALCSPTRSTFLTGRNHHLNGFASISESSTGFPGYSSHIPPEQIGVILFMFLVGIELDVGAPAASAHAAVLVSHASIIVPFFLGSALRWRSTARWRRRDVPFSAFALFMGIGDEDHRLPGAGAHPRGARPHRARRRRHGDRLRRRRRRHRLVPAGAGGGDRRGDGARRQR